MTSTSCADRAEAEDTLPILFAQPSPAWVAEHRDEIFAWISGFGAVLVRGLSLAKPAEVGDVAAALGVEQMAEREGFAHRVSHSATVYSSSHWPAADPMCMHHEGSYSAQVPGLILFGCLTAPESGGRTCLADSQKVLRALPPELIAPFQRDGWVLRRMYYEVGNSWTDAFGTEDPAEVDAYCARSWLDHEWLPDGRLRTAQRRGAVLRHPRTGTPGWFNQIAFLNGVTLDPAVREYLIDLYGPAGLPFDTAYADGSAVTVETVDAINEVYGALAVGKPWRDGDLLIVDNLRMAHSREAYTGAREIAVVFGDPVRPDGHVRSMR